jgi:hypothetical protein
MTIGQLVKLNKSGGWEKGKGDSRLGMAKKKAMVNVFSPNFGAFLLRIFEATVFLCKTLL